MKNIKNVTFFKKTTFWLRFAMTFMRKTCRYDDIFTWNNISRIDSFNVDYNKFGYVTIIQNN